MLLQYCRISLYCNPTILYFHESFKVLFQGSKLKKIFNEFTLMLTLDTCLLFFILTTCRIVEIYEFQGLF